MVAILSGDTLSASVSGSGCCVSCALVGLWFWCFGGVFLLDCFFFFFLQPCRAVSRDAGCSSSYHHRAAGGSEPLQPWHSAGLGKLCWRTGMHVLYMFFPVVFYSFCNPLTGWEDQLLVSPLVSIDIMAGRLFLLVPLSLWSHVECSSFVHTWRYALFLHSPPSSWHLQVVTQTYSLDANLCLLRLYQVLSFYANLIRHKMTV
jgi:hypothetical protein